MGRPSLLLIVNRFSVKRYLEYEAGLVTAVFRIRKIFIRIRILRPVSIITDLDPTCSPAIVNEHYWSMHHISKLKVPIQKFSLPYPVRSAICIFGIKEIDFISF